MQRLAIYLRRSIKPRILNLDGGYLPEPGIWGADIETGVCNCHYYATQASIVQSRNSTKGVFMHDQAQSYEKLKDGQAVDHENNQVQQTKRLGRSISEAEKRKFLVNTLLDLKDSKEAVYGTLDTWVAWEPNFPLVSLKRALVALEKEEQWHRIVQVIKWMLSKGQGTTMGTYEQLIRALEKDNRAEEAHGIWVQKVSHVLHSVPWRVLELMLSIYLRNNMLERLIKLFREIESYDRKPPYKSIVRKVADAYETLGLLDEKDRLLKQYSDLFDESSREHSRKSKRLSRKTGKTSKKGWKNSEPTSIGHMDSRPSDAEMQGTI